MLIGLVGNLGCGKDYITNNFIIPYLGKEKTQILSLGDSLKVELMVHMNIDFKKLYIKKDKDSRNLLQVYGTDIMRRKHGDDIWIKYLNSWISIHKHRGKMHFIIPDIRFKNEAEYIKKNNGFLIKIEAKDRNLKKSNEEKLDKEMNHISEKSVSEIESDLYLDNSKNNQDNVLKDLMAFLVKLGHQ